MTDGTPHTDHAHELCLGDFCTASMGPHCAECGAPALTVAIWGSIPRAGAEPPTCRERTIASLLDGMTVDEMKEVYGEELAEVLADVQAAVDRA